MADDVNELIEVKKEVLITPEDVTAALDFWKHFNIPLFEGLQEAVDAFIAEPNYENQEAIKFYVCKAVTETDHPAFKDMMFEKIAEECRAVSFNMQFDRDIAKVLGENDSE